jgi:prepilin-type N-terminal cleavage/methylation domain-containing protein
MNKRGFTLIELLLVLAIIGIISAIAIPAMLGQKQRSRQKAEVVDETIMSVEEMITANGPPDKMDKLETNGTIVSFAYYKQMDGSYKVYTIKFDRVIKETRKRL